MKINTLSECLIYIDSNAHYIPIVGTAVSLISIFEKCIVLPFMDRTTITDSRYFSYISNKSSDVFLFACMPVLGSIAIHKCSKNSDYTKKQKSLLKAVCKDSAFLQHADKNLIKNANFMIAAIKVRWSAIKYVHLDLKKDQDFMLKAIKVDCRIMGYADSSLKSNQTFMLEAIKIDPHVMTYADNFLKSNHAFMLEAINVNYRIINYSDSFLKSNQTFMLEATKTDPHVMTYANNFLKSNHAFMLEAIKIDPQVIFHASSSLKNNQTFMLEAIKVNYRAMAYTYSPLKSNLTFILEATKVDYRAINYADSYLKSNQILMLKVIKIDPRVILYADSSLTSNEDFMLKSIKINYRTIIHADSSLRNNQDFILKAIKIDPRVILYADNSLTSNEDFMLKSMKIDHQIIKYISEHLKANDHFMNLVVLGKPQAMTFSGNVAINSIMNLEKLHLAPPSMKKASLTLENLDKYDITNLSKEFNKLTEAEFLKYEVLSKSNQNERESANKALEGLKGEREKLAHLCNTVKKGPSENVSEAKKIFYEHLSFLLKSIISQWQSSKGLKCKDENLRALAYAATKCEPTWLEEATRIHFALEGSGTPEAKLLTLVQKYKEATILQFVQENNQWHALSRIRRDYGKELGLNIDLAKHDMYINTGEENNTPTIWTVKALWDAPSLLESVHTALSNQEYDRSLYDFLLEITKKKNIENSVDYVADNFYEKDCIALKLHGIHTMLIHIGVLEAMEH